LFRNRKETVTSITKLKTSRILEQSLDEAFPAVDPGVEPFGSLVLLQIKAAATKTKSGLVLTNPTVETESDNTRVAKVIAAGPLAFHDRAKQEPWPEGAWAQPGDYVRIGLYGGDRWRVLVEEFESRDRNGNKVVEKIFAEFALIEDLNLKGKVTGDPLAQLAFI
jgi:co-chaperonin GroES (HSP10)